MKRRPEGSKRQRTAKKKLEDYAKRVSSPKEREYFIALFSELIENNAIPLELLEDIPIAPEEAGKTRFDQLYDAAMQLVFPGYRKETLGKLLGPEHKSSIKIWRAIFPEKFELSGVLFRASSFQEAFALACDYACRVSLRLFKQVPTDLTVRVQFVSERSVRRLLSIRQANRKKWRDQLKLIGRKHTPKEIYGARLAALGHPDKDNYSIAKYAEVRDLRKILNKKDVVRISSVERESFIREDEPPFM